MDRKRLFKILAYLIILIFLVNYVAVKLYWYNSIWYFDMIMHFLGGFWLSLALLWLFFKKDLSLKLIFKIFLGVLLIGVLWEVYEILVNNTFAQNPFNTLDTISDIFFDLSGGVFAILYFLKRTMLLKENKVNPGVEL